VNRVKPVYSQSLLLSGLEHSFLLRRVVQATCLGPVGVLRSHPQMRLFDVDELGSRRIPALHWKDYRGVEDVGSERNIVMDYRSLGFKIHTLNK